MTLMRRVPVVDGPVEIWDDDAGRWVPMIALERKEPPMDHEIKLDAYDAENSVSATLITRLTEAEEARWRGMLADAWDEGWDTGRKPQFIGKTDRSSNPYRQ